MTITKSQMETLLFILSFGFDPELFQEIKFQISGNVRCGELFVVRELKILGMNNSQFPTFKDNKLQVLDK